MKRNNYRNLIFFILTCLFVLSACQGSNDPELVPEISEMVLTNTQIPQNNSTETASPMPTETAEPSQTPLSSATATRLPDIGYAMVSPYDSKELKIGNGPIDTWIDEEGMHVSFAALDEHKDQVTANIHCSDKPYGDEYLDWQYWYELADEQPLYGDFSRTYYTKTGGKTHLDLFFRSGNCVVAIYAFLNAEIPGDEIYPDLAAQTFGVADIIEERLPQTTAEYGIQVPSTEIVPGLFEEVFNSLSIYRWGEPFRSYSVEMEVKKPFIAKSTFGVFDVQKQAFIFRREILGYPPIGEVLLDNLGENLSYENVRKTLDWDGDYQLWVWIEDELVGIYELEKYEQPESH